MFAQIPALVAWSQVHRVWKESPGPKKIGLISHHNYGVKYDRQITGIQCFLLAISQQF